MPYSPEFQNLVAAVDTETRLNEEFIDPSMRRFSQLREANDCTFDCNYSGENIVDFTWTAGDGVALNDRRIGDICMYWAPEGKISERKEKLFQYILTTSGVVLLHLDEQFDLAGPGEMDFLTKLLKTPS
jgi:hypothetical protein